MKFLRIGLIATFAAAVFTISAAAAGTTNIDGGTVNASLLNLRSAPDTGAYILDQAPSGDALIVVADAGNGWYQVNYGGTVGYMSGEYINLGPVNADLGGGRLTGDSVRIRSGPDTTYTILGAYNTGDELAVIGVSGAWYKVTDGTTTGYIRSDYIELTGKPVNINYASASVGQKIVDTAMKYLGVPYVWGGTSSYGFDCSGLVYYVYKENGYSINRRASTIWYNGYFIDKDSLQVGDPVFFSNDSSNEIEHVGIYIGNGQFIHASSGGGCVKINSLSDAYYLRNYYGAVRII